MHDINTPVVSVIVPVYNAEKYLSYCVDSLLKQTYQIFEIILIDDGSRDACGEICDHYAQIDKRVRVFHKENGGVSSARNLGLDVASGEWIAFVDSDDYADEDFLNSILDAQDNIDVIHFGYRKEMSNNKLYPQNLFGETKIVTFEDFFSKGVFSSCSVSYFYRRSAIGNIRFNENLKRSEDREFIIKVILNSNKSILLTKNTDYVYRYNIESATNKKQNDNHYIDDLSVLRNIGDNINNIWLNKTTVKFIFNLFIKSFFLTASILYFDYKRIIPESRMIIRQINKKYKVFSLELFVYTIFPYAVILKYKLYWKLRHLYYNRFK